MLEFPYLRFDKVRGQQIGHSIGIVFLFLCWIIGVWLEFDLFPRSGAVLVGLSVLVSLFAGHFRRAEIEKIINNMPPTVRNVPVRTGRDSETAQTSNPLMEMLNERLQVRLSFEQQEGISKVAASWAIFGTLAWGFGDLFDGVKTC